MPSPLTPLARRLAGPGTGVRVPSKSCPRPGAALLWALLAALATCCLAAALSPTTNLSAVPGPDGADSTEAPGVQQVEEQCEGLVRRHVE
jgi:hypothetical protein